MDNSKKLSQYDIRTVLSMTDLFPSLVDNGDGTYTNKVTPLSAIRAYSAVPSGGTTAQVLQKTNNTDYSTSWHSLVKADVGLGNVDNTADTAKPVSTATTAAIAAATQALYPVGSIYINATSSTNPGTLLGFGTWTAFGAGRVPVGFDSSQTEFDTAEKTGGSKTHTHTLSDAGYAKLAPVGNTQRAARIDTPSWTSNHRQDISSAANESTSSVYGLGLGGSSDSGSTLQPYITVYMWKRTA